MGSGWNTILGIALLFLVFLIVATVFFAKDKGFLPRLASKALSLGDYFLPEQAPTEMRQGEKLPDKVIRAQTIFTENIRKSIEASSGETCILDFDLSGLDKYEMQVYGPGITSRIVDPKKYGQVLLNPDKMDNAEIYLVNGKKFNECFVESKLDCKLEEVCYAARDTITLSQNSLRTTTKPYGIANFMIFLSKSKIPSNRFCLIPTHSGIFSSCYYSDSIHVDCLKDFKVINRKCLT